MGWFGKLRKDARPADRDLPEESKQQKPAPAQALPRSPSTRGSDGRKRYNTSDRRRELPADNDLRGDRSVTETVSSGGASHRRRLRARRQKLQYFARSSREDITALPGSRELNISPHLRPVAQEDADIPYNFYLPSTSHTNVPTTPASGRLARRSPSKRTADTTPLPKRRSTKRRKDEHVREEEIRAMSGPANTGRPRRSTYDSGILKKDSKRVRGGLNRNFERPMSNVSLPFQESVHSSMSGGSDPFSYHLNRLEVFAPRPLIRQSVNAQYSSGLNASMWSARADSRATERRANRKPTPSKEILKGRKTVDELADNLDSSDLRAVLERDHRRKEAQRQKELEKVKRRLERKAEKERRREMGETNSPSKRKRKDLEKHLGLGVESPLLSEVEAPKRKKKDLEKHLGDAITDDKLPPTQQQRQQQQQQQQQAAPPLDEEDALRKETLAEYRRVLQASGSFPASPTDTYGAQREDALRLGTPLDEAILLNIHPAFRPSPAQSPIPSPNKPLSPTAESTAHERLQKVVTSPVAEEAPSSPDAVEALPPLPTSPTSPSSPSKDAPTSSRHSSRRSSKGWTSIFKRGPSLRKENERPAAPMGQTFSNISRDSIQRNLASRASYAGGAAGVAPLPSRSLSQTDSDNLNIARTGSASTAATSRRDRSGTPVRTMSKFREDLPELPLSLTDSRQQSTDLGVPSLTGGAIAKQGDLSPALPIPSDGGSVSGPSSAAGADEKHRSTGLMSTSLASVDSEASWISGRPLKHPSVRRSARNSTIGGGIRKVDESAGTSRDDLSFADERLQRSDDAVGDRNESLAQDDEDEAKTIVTEIEQRAAGVQEEQQGGDEVLGLKTGDVGKTPRLIEREPTVKSREGLLNEFNASAPATESTAKPEEPTAAERSLPTPEPEASNVNAAAIAATVATAAIAATATAAATTEGPESHSDEPSSERSFEQLPADADGANEPVVLRRASSVTVNHSHARQVSAGSAKLLDIHSPLRKPGSTSSFPSSIGDKAAADATSDAPAKGSADALELTPPPTALVAGTREVETPQTENVPADEVEADRPVAAGVQPEQAAPLEGESTAPVANEPTARLAEEPAATSAQESTAPAELTPPPTAKLDEQVQTAVAETEPMEIAEPVETAKPVEAAPPVEPAAAADTTATVATTHDVETNEPTALTEESAAPVELTPPATATLGEQVQTAVPDTEPVESAESAETAKPAETIATAAAAGGVETSDPTKSIEEPAAPVEAPQAPAETPYEEPTTASDAKTAPAASMETAPAVQAPVEPTEETPSAQAPSESMAPTLIVPAPSEVVAETAPLQAPSEAVEETTPVQAPSDVVETTPAQALPETFEEKSTQPPDEAAEDTTAAQPPVEAAEESASVPHPSEHMQETSSVQIPAEATEETTAVQAPSEAVETAPVQATSEAAEEATPVQATPEAVEETTVVQPVSEPPAEILSTPPPAEIETSAHPPVEAAETTASARSPVEAAETTASAQPPVEATEGSTTVQPPVEASDEPSSVQVPAEAAEESTQVQSADHSDAVPPAAAAVDASANNDESAGAETEMQQVPEPVHEVIEPIELTSPPAITSTSDEPVETATVAEKNLPAALIESAGPASSSAEPAEVPPASAEKDQADANEPAIPESTVVEQTEPAATGTEKGQVVAPLELTSTPTATAAKDDTATLPTETKTVSEDENRATSDGTAFI